MRTRTLRHALAAIVLTGIVLVGPGQSGSAPHTKPCGHQGYCLCVPNVRNYGYYPTQWRRWPTEIRRDEHFPQSLGRERIPTPPGEPTEPLPIERVPTRPMPGIDEFPIPDGILPPEGPFEPQIPILPEADIPGIIPPFIPSTTPRSLPGAGIPGQPSKPGNPTPFEEPAQPEPSGPPQGALPTRGQLPPPSVSKGRTEANLAAVKVNHGAPLPEPEAWANEPQPGSDATRPQASIEADYAVRPTTHQSVPKRAPQPENPVPAAFVDHQTVAGPPVMLDGFCPVTLSKRGQWRQGQREYLAVYRDLAFHMAGPEERQQFLANPHHFAPMFGGVDPVLVVDEQRWTPGSTHHSAMYKGRIYMLSSKANLERFQKDPRRYAFELDE